MVVVPGTQHVTLGGATANDVHGKNHFRAGSFGCHVREIELLRSDRGCTVCSLERDEELFRATIGGLGLTGLMLRVRLQLRRVPGALMRVEEQPFASLAEYVALLRERQDREYSVAWIDGSRLGAGCRGLASFADHAPGACGRRRRSIGVPVTLPLSLVGNTTAWCFSRAYAALRARRASAGDVDHAAYFFPLDGVGGWNRLYGPRGLRQYQCVIPVPGAEEGAAEILREVHRSGLVSALIVLKDFGPRASPGLLSFPREGLTLAMDFPESGERLRALFARLDAVTTRLGRQTAT